MTRNLMKAVIIIMLSRCQKVRRKGCVDLLQLVIMIYIMFFFLLLLDDRETIVQWYDRLHEKITAF